MVFAVLAVFGLGASGAMAQTVKHAWVQYDGMGQPQARVVVDTVKGGTTTCPAISHDNGSVTLSLRSDFAPGHFNEIRVCFGAVDARMSNMKVGGFSLPTPSTAPQKIAVVGDTGCRVKGGDVQDCDGLAQAATPTAGSKKPRPAWDYIGLANATAAVSPDLLIHVGDMHYRESGYCGTNCDQATVGYSWVSWEADYFAPSKALFAAAPIIAVRGNHEDCTRAWAGWFYLLDPHPIAVKSWPVSCPGFQGAPVDSEGDDWSYTLPYPVTFDNFQVIVMDSSRIDDDYTKFPDPATVKQYAVEFSGVELFAQGASVPSWLVTHRPFWAVASYGSDLHPKASKTDLTLQKALAQSVQKTLPSEIKMVMAGHIHLAQALKFPDHRPMQFVFGNSGTKRDPALGDASGLYGKTLRALSGLGVAQTDFYWSYDFDFGMITPSASDWAVTFNDKAGNVMKSFTVAH